MSSYQKFLDFTRAETLGRMGMGMGMGTEKNMKTRKKQVKTEKIAHVF